MCYEWERDKDGVTVTIEQDESSRGTRAASAFIPRAELMEMLRATVMPDLNDERRTFIKAAELAQVLGVREASMGRWGVFVRGRLHDAVKVVEGRA